MRKWALVLHLYQPPTQELELTELILKSSYLPILDILLAHPQVQMTFNINSSLLVQLEKIDSLGFFDKVKQLLNNGQLELLNSPFHHPLIPLTPRDTVKHQLDDGLSTHQHFFYHKPIGVYPPELGLNKDSLDLFKDLNYKYSLIDEISINPDYKLGVIPKQLIYKYKDLYLATSVRTLTEIIRSYPSQLKLANLDKFIQQNTDDNQLIISVNDAELFGHHYSERINFFRELIESPNYKFIRLSTAIQKYGKDCPTIGSIRAATWQTSKENLVENNPYPVWINPQNQLQKEFYDLMQFVYENYHSVSAPIDDEGLIYSSAERHYFEGTSSCHPYWLSNEPWWYPDLVQKGAENLVQCIRTLALPPAVKIEAEQKYHNFLMHLWQHHWSGEVEKKYTEYSVKHQKDIETIKKIVDI